MHVIRISKRKHYTDLIKASHGDQKQCWKVLNEVLSRGHKTTVLPDTRIKQNAQINFNGDDLANSFNNHFNSIGKTLSETISPPEGAIYQQYLQGNYVNSFFLAPTDKTEVTKIIMSMKSSHTAGVDGICSKIIKRHYE